MITDEKVMKIIQNRQIERYKNGERDPKLLNYILVYLTQNNDENLLEIIVTKNGIDDFRKVDNGIQTLEDIVIKSECAQFIYDFARFTKEANITKLEDAMAKTKNAKYIYFFAGGIKGANIPKLEKAMLETKNMEYIYKFARNIDGVSLEFLREVMNKLEQTDYILETKIKKIEEEQSILQRQASENIISYATKIISGDRKKALDELIDEGNMLKLKIYGEFLTAKKVTMEEALELDKEYTEYPKTKKKVNKKTNNE